jgi:di/tricarboxylate transporter
MSADAWITAAIVGVLFVGLLRNLAPPDVLFVAATALLAALDIISPVEAFAGFSNSGMLTIAFLFVVVAGLRETGVLDHVGRHVLGRARSERGVLARLTAVIVPMSALLNNTPIVAMFVPIVIDWCRRQQIAPSKLLLPLSYLAILGGTCTLIGTTTNLVVNGLMVDNGLPGMTLLEIGKVGLPYAVIGSIYLFLAAPRLLPRRTELLEQLSDARRDYLIEMRVQPDCRLSGQTVEAAGLRQLPGLFLIEIEREGQILAPVRPEDRIEIHDRLVFAGIVSSIIELEKIKGLVPLADAGYVVSPSAQRDGRLCEAVISQHSSLIGKTIREADFRATYGAAVLAVHRFGERIEMKLGDITLHPGDTLLLQTGPTFVRTHRHDANFYLVSMVDDWRPVRRDRAWIALALFVLLLGVMISGEMPIVVATALAAVLMVLLGCLSPNDATQSIEWQVLVTIAASFGVGAALHNSGAASTVAQFVVASTEIWGPVAAIAVIYCFGSLMTEVITNNAAAVLMFPFCLETARLYEADSRPFLIALALSASASFMTPIGYQTNMMVYGPGGYRFTDFLRFGAPLNLLLACVAVVLIPLFWPFYPG